MPVVTIQMWEGRSVEQKRNLVKAITKAMVEIAGASADKLYIIIHDVSKGDWGMNGTLASDLPSRH